jgi:hypothetical protein
MHYYDLPMYVQVGTPAAKHDVNIFLHAKYGLFMGFDASPEYFDYFLIDYWEKKKRT